jgi:hypothetical protein
MRRWVFGLVSTAVIFAAPAALADCREDIEAIELAGLQNATTPIAESSNMTPTQQGLATYSKEIQDILREAEAALAANDEDQCLAMLSSLRKRGL